MSLYERQRQFVEQIRNDPDVGDTWKISQLYGVSNSAKVIDKGLLLGVSNLDGLGEDRDGAVFVCVIKFPPEDEVYFAVYVHSGMNELHQRLRLMLEIAQRDQDSGLAPRNNNVRLYLANDGRLYLHNKTYWDELDEDTRNTHTPSITVDKIVYAVYPPAPSAQRSLLAREFVGYLARFVGRERVHEVQPWDDEALIGPEMRRMPLTIPIEEIESTISELGGHYVDDLIKRFHISLNYLESKHFVILTGLSGTGKTSLVRYYSQAVHGITDNRDPLFFNCPVRPEWTDPTGLTGYYDMISDRYNVPPFLEAILVATTYRESPVFVCLDEMNLARVEYYLSDILSAMESGHPIQLHPHSTPLEGSTGGEIPASIPLPPNLYIIGTINIDETTHPISDKVLDRAVVIDLSTVDLEGYFTQLREENPDLTDSINSCKTILIDVNEILRKEMQHFGYRIAMEFVSYHYLAMQFGTPSTEVIDHLMIQKVLIKLRGSEKQRKMLEDLKEKLAEYPKALQAIQSLIDELGELGSFQYSR